MATFEPPTHLAPVVSSRDLAPARRLLRFHSGNPQAENVFLYDDDTQLIVDALPPALYDSTGNVTTDPLERLSASFYGARGPYTVTATQQATLEAAGYTVDG